MNRIGARTVTRSLNACELRGNAISFIHALLLCFVAGFGFSHSPAHAASAISLAGIDYARLCRETTHVPLVHAAIHPAYINVWTVQESRQHGRYEQYSFRTQRIDVRVEHDISLYHGLIHRTLDLIGESQWKYRDLLPQEDHEHWLIYYTLERHWPGLQRRQGNEPTRALLTTAIDYWQHKPERYREIEAKAAVLAKRSWCAINAPQMEAPTLPQPKSLPAPAAQIVRPLPAQQAVATATPPVPEPQSVARLPGPQPAPAPQRPLPAESLLVEPIWVMSEFAGSRPAPATPPARTISGNQVSQPESRR